MNAVAPTPLRAKVMRLEEQVARMPQRNCPIRHIQAERVYAREMTIPADTTVVGAVHKRDNIASLLRGRLLVVTDGAPQIVVAPRTMLIKAGTKTAVYAIEECVWTNYFFGVDESDTDKLVEILTESKASELIGGKQNKQLLQEKASCLLDS